MFFWIIEERIEAHSVKEHKNIPEQDRQRMTHKQVMKAFGLRRLQILGPGHYGKRANMGTAELGVVIMMVVVRASPNAAGAEGQDAKDPHQALGQSGMGQYRLMLLIVVNHKKPEYEQPGENTADNLADKIEVPESARQANRQQKRCRENAPPTPCRRIRRIRFGGQYEFFSGSHVRFNYPNVRPRFVIWR
jgi:hypothetical protein